MLVIRLRRIGRKHDPHYRLVVAEHTAPVQGKFLAEVGHYHPKSKDLVIEQDKFLAWLEQGAKPSNTVSRLAERASIAHPQISVIEYQGKPKQKAQERSDAKAGKSAAPQETTTESSESPSSEETLAENTTPEAENVEATATEAPEPDAPETEEEAI